MTNMHPMVSPIRSVIPNFTLQHYALLVQVINALFTFMAAMLVYASPDFQVLIGNR